MPTADRDMGRGRTPTVSDDRLLVELLLHQDRRVMAGELAEQVGVTGQTIRTRMEDLEDDGLVTRERASNRNLYRLTKDGRVFLKTLLRDRYE